MANKINELVALLNTVPAGQLTENAVQTYLNILNIEIVDKGSVDTTVNNVSESPKAKVARLLAEAKKDLSDNIHKYGFSERSVRDVLEKASSEFARKRYKYAFNELNYCSALSNNFEKYPELMSALAELDFEN